MYLIKRCIFFILLIASLAGCKKKKASMTGEEPVEVTDFMEVFQPLTLPFKVADTLVNKKDKDSTVISYKIFTQFVPDSIFSKAFGKNVKPKIYPLGKAGLDKSETYLLAKAVQGNKKNVYLICFDKDNKFIAAMPLVVPDQSATTQQTGTIDKNFTITKNIQRKNADGSISEGRDAYVLNGDTKSFMLIMTDALDEKPAELINPIDTLPKKNKLSGDYLKNKTNIVSIRDTKRPDRILVFVHIEQNNGECVGELKGEATLKSPTLAEYSEAGNPCLVQFNFTGSTVTMKEVEGCGSYRGLRCLFDGTYTRKKEVKPKEPKKKTSTKK